MKRTCVIAASLLLVIAALAGCKQESGPAIGVIDMERAYQSNKATEALMSHLQAKQAPLAEKVNKALEAMKKDQNEQTVKAYNDTMGEAQAIMQMEQQRVVPILNKAFNKVLEDYRQEHKLTVILNRQMVPAVAPGADVTDDIIAAMDKVTLDLSEPAPAAAPEKAAPAETKAPEAEKAAPAAPEKAE